MYPIEIPRHDLYAGIHKALRHFMLDTLMRVGCLETRDAAETGAVLGQVEALLAQCGGHLRHENDFIHPALEDCRPGSAARVAADHVDHVEHIASLRTDVRRLRAAPPEMRAAEALRLYRHLALFVAENFQHMHHEETVHNATLWAHYTDDELGALHGRLVASLAPQEMFDAARWMIPAMNPSERAALLNDMRDNAPAPAFAALVAHVRPHLDATAWSRLAPEIGYAPAAEPA